MKRRMAAILSVAIMLSTLATPVVAQATPSTPAPLEWVHLADSFGSGTGAGSYQEGTRGNCWRSDNSYAEKLADQVRASGQQVNFTNVACSGAKIPHLYTTFKGQPPQLDALSLMTELVTVQIGGNDADFGTYAGQCLNADCSGLPTLAVLSRLPQIGQSLGQLFRDIKQRTSPEVRIVLVGYGQIITWGANAPNVQLDPICGSRYLTRKERLAANAVSSLLDSELSQAVTSARRSGINVVFASPYVAPFVVVPPFHAHSLCESGVPYYNGFAGISTDPAGLDGLLHPNADGHTATVPLVRQAARI